MKERLKELLRGKSIDQEVDVEYVADFLLSEGVIVPPCKVGDTVYTVIFKSNYINSAEVVGFHLGKFPTLRGSKIKEYLVCYSGYCLRHIDIDQIGKTVFLDRASAEAKLREMEGIDNEKTDK